MESEKRVQLLEELLEKLTDAYYDAKETGDMDALDIAINDIFKELGIDMKSKGGSIEKAIR